MSPIPLKPEHTSLSDMTSVCVRLFLCVATVAKMPGFAPAMGCLSERVTDVGDKAHAVREEVVLPTLKLTTVTGEVLGTPLLPELLVLKTS
jgi:hypothetical protein